MSLIQRLARRTATFLSKNKATSSQRKGEQGRCFRFEQLEDRRVMAAGDLDNTFDGNGKNLFTMGGDDRAEQVRVDSLGRSVIVGTTQVGGKNKFAISRLTTSGALDTTFSGDGKLTISFGSTRDDRAMDVLIDSGNKIVVVGWSLDSSSKGDFAIARINANGSLDASFSTDGLTRINWGGDERAYGVTKGHTGGYLISGHAVGTSGTDFAVARLTSSGAVDTTFSSDGKSLYNFTGRDDIAAKIVRDGKDGYFIGGSTSSSSDSDFGLVHFGESGAVKTSFSSDGFQRVGFGNVDVLTGIAFDATTQTIVASGATLSALNASNMAVARLKLTGAFDTTFSSDGKFIVPTSGIEVSNKMVVDSLGRIYLVGGYINAAGTVKDFSVVRIKKNGAMDTTFKSTGRLLVGMATGTIDTATGVGFDGSGRLVVVGLTRTATATTNNFGAMRIKTA